MRCGLISDTHGYLDPRVKDLFREVDLIVHAGDVGSSAVLEGLRDLAPLKAVRGNNDRSGACARLAHHLLVRLEDVPTLVIHEIGKPSRIVPLAAGLVKRHHPQLVVYGHSHVPHDEVRDGVRFFNPGSAGKKRFRLPRTCALLTVRRSEMEFERFSLE